MALALRQLATKWSAAQVALLPRRLSSSGGGCGVVLREKMSEREIKRRRYVNITRKINAEYDVLPSRYYDDDDDEDDDRFPTDDFGALKSLLKELRKINRKNGVVPPPPMKNRKCHRHVGGGAIEMLTRHVDDEAVIETALIAMEKYKKDKSGSSLEFVSVLQVEFGRGFGEYNIIIQARDRSAAGVSVKLIANCFVTFRRVHHVGLYRPACFMDVLHKGKGKSKTTLMNADDKHKKTGDVEALLYANLRDCPIIDRRLGLKRQELHRDASRRSVVNLSLDDDIVMRVAKFAVNQRPDLHFLAVTGAWREKIKDRRYLYHVIFEANGDGLTRRFYSAISVNAKGGAAKLVDLKAVDCPRATIN